MDKVAVVDGQRVSTTALDVRDSRAVSGWLSDGYDREKRPDGLIINAGVIRDNRVQKIYEEDWHTVLDVNLTGAVTCSRAALPFMREAGYGRLLFFSSMSWTGNFGQANYVAAKAGVVGLTRALALETARDGITCNAIAPGLIETPMLASMHKRGREPLVGKIPQRRTGLPADIAEAAAFHALPRRPLHHRGRP